MTQNNIQDEFREIEPNSSNKIVFDLIDYIGVTLPNFPNSNEFVDILEKKKNENQHSLFFCVFMTNKCKSRFYFCRENSQKGSHTIDIGVYLGSNLIFTIEAKLLPTPKGKKRIEHEYVYGKGGGIQRFRDGFHGVDNCDNPLCECGMIAYVKENEFKYWLSKINQWILDAKWDESEQLRKIYFKLIAKLFSSHPRPDSPDITLYHFWVYVNK